MLPSEFRASLDLLHKRLRDLTETKGQEYKGGEEKGQFDNFERHAAAMGMTREQVLFVYLSKHLDSITTWIKDQAAGNNRALSEPIEGRITDAILYLWLLRGMSVGDSFTIPHKDTIKEGDICHCGYVRGSIACGDGKSEECQPEVERWGNRDNFGGAPEPMTMRQWSEDNGRYWSAEHEDSARAALRTLRQLGYSYTNGAELWKPPLGTPPEYITESDAQIRGATSISVISARHDEAVEICNGVGVPPTTGALSAPDQLHGVKPGGHVIFVHHGNRSDEGLLESIRARAMNQSLTVEVFHR